MAQIDTKWLEHTDHILKTMPKDALAVRELAKNDLYYFATLVNPGYMYGEIHKDLFKWMESYTLFGKGTVGITNKMLMLPRAHLKSHCVATWAAWIIVRHPEVTMLYTSATAGLAIAQLFAIKNILTSKQFTRYFPEYVHPAEGKRERWSQDEIMIDHPKRAKEGIRDATITTAGLTTNTTGWHADILLLDDLVVPENAYTEDGRTTVAKKVSQFTSILNAGGFTMACGTRYHPADIYAAWKAQEFDIYNEQDEVIDKQPVWDIQEHAVEVEGVFLWPKVVRPSDLKVFGFNNQVLAKIRAQYEDRTQFHAQYYNNPNDAGSNRIDRSKFQYADRKFLKYIDDKWYFKGDRLNIFASIDFAFSLGKRSDSTAVVVIGIDHESRIYVLDIDWFKTDKISEYFDRVVALHSKWDFTKLRAEVTVAQTVIVRDLKERFKQAGLRLVIEEYRPTRREGSKEERIASALEPKYDNQLVWHFKGGFTDVLEEELVMARPPHDDIKDALASAVEIAVKPRGSSKNVSNRKSNNISFHSRFGGTI
jgi:hypothetical protein